MKPFLEVANRHFYVGCDMQPLGGGERLLPDELTRLASAQEAGIFAPVYENLSKGSSPGDIVAGLC